MTLLFALFDRFVDTVLYGSTATNFFVGYPDTNFFVFHLTIGILYLVITRMRWYSWISGRFVGRFGSHRVTYRVTRLLGCTWLGIWFGMKCTPNLMPKLFLCIQNCSYGPLLSYMLGVSIAFDYPRIAIIANSLLNNSAFSPLVSCAFIFLRSGALRLVDRLAHIFAFIFELAIIFARVEAITDHPTIAGWCRQYRLIPFILGVTFRFTIRGLNQSGFCKQ